MLRKIRRLDANLSAEKGAREALQARFDALEMSAMNTSSLVKACDLIKLFRSYHLISYNWDAVTNEYKGQEDKNLSFCPLYSLVTASQLYEVKW